MSQKSTYGIPRGSPMDQATPVKQIKCKKGSATVYGTLNEVKFKSALKKLFEDLDRAGELEHLLEKEEAPAATGTSKK